MRLLPKLSNNKKYICIFKFLIISLLLQNNKSNHYAIIESQEQKLAEIRSEFNSFLKKYKTNSCIMQIFSQFQKNCDEMTDNLNSHLSIQMTICLYNNLNKQIPPDCKEGKITLNNCLKYLEGDAWTTYITFSHHIDNLCFYYKTLLWEKSSEFLFMKLLNTSMGVLAELSHSQRIAKEMIDTHERFSSHIEQNFVETMNNFKNFNQFFENYTKSEEYLKENIQALETKINQSNQKMKSMAEYIDEKLEYLYYIIEIFHNKEKDYYSLYYYLVIFSLSFIFTAFKSTRKIRIFIIFLIFGFFIFEKLAHDSICNSYCSNSQFFIHLGYICCNLIFYFFRIVFSFALLIIILIKCYNYSQSKKNKKNKELDFLDDYKSFLNITPMWMKKYFSRINFQNEELIGKFKKMNKMMVEEKLLMLNRKEKKKDNSFSSDEDYEKF